MIAPKKSQSHPESPVLPCGRPAAFVEDRRRRMTWTVPDLNFAGSSRLWDSTLLDRLQSPLTRFHD
jgi:hypothetical protein